MFAADAKPNESTTVMATGARLFCCTTITRPSCKTPIANSERGVLIGEVRSQLGSVAVATHGSYTHECEKTGRVCLRLHGRSSTYLSTTARLRRCLCFGGPVRALRPCAKAVGGGPQPRRWLCPLAHHGHRHQQRALCHPAAHTPANAHRHTQS